MTINAKDRFDKLPEERKAKIKARADEMEEEDRLDNEAADAAMEDVKLHGTIPWEELKRDLGLTPPPPPASPPDKE
jgi:TRAP-type C4-dicarboxylate transport system substrate-binding protein